MKTALSMRIILLLLLWISNGFTQRLGRKTVLAKPAKVSQYRGTQYLYFTHDRVTFWQARADCKDRGAMLLMIKDNETQQHIENEMPYENNCDRSFYYMGLFLNGSDWMWPDGSYLANQSFSRWRMWEPNNTLSCHNEPNGYRGCSVQLRANASQISSCFNNSKAHIGDWFDKHEFYSKWYYICQKPYISTTRAATTTAPTTKRLTTTTAKLITTPSTETRSIESSGLPASSESFGLSTNVVELASTETQTVFESSTRAVTRETQTNTTAFTSALSSEATTPLGTSLSLKDCLKLFIQNFSEALMKECNLVDTFGQNFTIQKWERLISSLFGEVLLEQNQTKSLKINQFSGMTISLYKMDSSLEMTNMLTTPGSPENNLALTFKKNSSSSFLFDPKIVQELPFPLSIVSARFDYQIWEQSRLGYVPPASKLNINPNVDKFEISNVFQTLPHDEDVMSLSIFVPKKDALSFPGGKRVVKKTIPVRPIFEFSIDPEKKDILSIENEEYRRIALNGIYYQCSFLSNDGTEWSTDGCFFEKGVNGVVSCNCEHTTTFGVLLAVRSFSIPKAVTTAVTVFEVATVVFLIITLLLLVWVKKSMHNDRTVVQINLALSLMLLHIFFLLSDFAAGLEETTFCITCAVFIQYLTLTTACWMLNEGVVLYFKTYKNALSFNLKKILPRITAVAWGFPLVYVAICAGSGLSIGVYMAPKPSFIFLNETENSSNISLNKTENGATNETSNSSVPKYDVCYVSFRSGMIYSVVAPLALILVITSGIIIKTSIKINAMTTELAKMRPSGKLNTTTRSDSPESRKKKEKKFLPGKQTIIKQASATLRALVLLLPVLGVTWFLGFLVNIPKAEVIFLVIHGVINGLQGVFIFYIYCVRNSQFRRVFSRRWSELTSNFVRTETYHSNKMSIAASHAHSHMASRHASRA